jgi:Mn2+/Fe2+ NRAMP family transporter
MLNGFVLPIALAILLIASGKSRLMGTYKHSGALLIMGWLVVAAMTALAIGIY